jgi:hypothetical protein
MSAADQLWRVNNEYRKRLGKVERYVDLLEQLMVARAIGSGDSLMAVLEVLQYAHGELNALEEEHRGWRYRYFYDSSDSKRMVQDDADINRALAHFSQMRPIHEQRLYAVYTALVNTPRPDPDITAFPSGDLWELLHFAFDDLAAFIVSPDNTVNA